MLLNIMIEYTSFSFNEGLPVDIIGTVNKISESKAR